MAQFVVKIPDAKVDLVLEAFYNERGIEATLAALKAEVISEIKQTVKTYLVKQSAKTIPSIEIS